MKEQLARYGSSRRDTGRISGALVSAEPPSFPLPKGVTAIPWPDVDRTLGLIARSSADSLEREVAGSLADAIQKKGFGSFRGFPPEGSKTYLSVLRENSSLFEDCQRSALSMLKALQRRILPLVGREEPLAGYAPAKDIDYPELNPNRSDKRQWMSCILGKRKAGKGKGCVIGVWIDLTTLDLWIGLLAYHKKAADWLIEGLRTRPSLANSLAAMDCTFDWWKGSKEMLEQPLNAASIKRAHDKSPPYFDIGPWIRYAGNEVVFSSDSIVDLLQSRLLEFARALKRLD
jgi:hypothetical protein